MTVKQLKDFLKTIDDDTQIVFSLDDGIEQVPFGKKDIEVVHVITFSEIDGKEKENKSKELRIKC